MKNIMVFLIMISAFLIQSLKADADLENKLKEMQSEIDSLAELIEEGSGSGDGDQIRAIISGQGDIALVNSYYFLKMKSQDNENKLNNVIEYFPNDKLMKTHINISGAGVVKNCKNKENAIKFLEFLVSNEAQKVYAEVNFEYPIRQNIELNSFMNKYNNFIKDNLNLTDIAKLNKKAIMLMDVAGWY